MEFKAFIANNKHICAATIIQGSCRVPKCSENLFFIMMAREDMFLTSDPIETTMEAKDLTACLSELKGKFTVEFFVSAETQTKGAKFIIPECSYFPIGHEFVMNHKDQSIAGFRPMQYTLMSIYHDHMADAYKKMFIQTQQRMDKIMFHKGEPLSAPKLINLCNMSMELEKLIREHLKKSKEFTDKSAKEFADIAAADKADK